MRQQLIRLAKRMEQAWDVVSLSDGPAPVEAGWYISEFTLDGVIRSTPRISVRRDDGKLAERQLVGAHSGRNRMLFYLPKGEIKAYSAALEFQILARVPTWEGRARVLLICWRYLLDFFSPWTFVRMLAMQFKNPFDLSTEVLQFYSPPEKTILEALEWWQRRPRLTRFASWWLRDITIGAVIEHESQHERLENMVCPPDCIELAGTDISLSPEILYWIPLSPSEELRSAGILLLKIAIWRARRKDAEPVLIYSDHDYAANQSQPQYPEPVFKPDPSLAYLYCFNYIGPAIAIASRELEDVSPAELLDESTRYRLCLRLLAQTDRVLHVPELLFTSRRTDPLSTPAPHTDQSVWPGICWQRAGDHNALRSEVVSEPSELASLPSIDLIVPTRDGLNFLEPCVTGLLEKTDYQNCHVYIVDNGSSQAETLDWLANIEQDPRVTVVSYPGEFNFSAINNVAVAQGNGDYIGLINNDIEVIHPDWLQQMMAWAVQPSVGIVGAKLLFGNGLVQHAGVTIGMGNAAGHIHRLEAGDAAGYQNRCIATQNMMAVTAACFVTPRALYEDLGGLNETAFKVAYNDIDYCLRVEKRGLDIIWTPEAKLYHHESVSRGDDMSEQHIKRYFKELKALQKRWKTKGFVDKYYNKHLRIGDEGVYPQIDVVGEDPLREL